MPEITLFCEDSFHEKFVGALLKRFGKDYGVSVTPRFLSAQGGLPRMHYEFKPSCATSRNSDSSFRIP
jgi:hypothetical protein